MLSLNNTWTPAASRSGGFTLIEALVTIVILAIGLLGLAKLQASTPQFAMESYQRAQAMILLQDMVNRINANRKSAACYAITNDLSSGTPFLGTEGNGYAGTPSCNIGTTVQQNNAVRDLMEWDQLLRGAAETSSDGSNAGAMIGARGCIAYDAANAVYVVTVVWQGLMQTAEPSTGLTCAKGLYGSDDESQRRAVSALIRIATLD